MKHALYRTGFVKVLLFWVLLLSAIVALPTPVVAQSCGTVRVDRFRCDYSSSPSPHCTKNNVDTGYLANCEIKSDGFCRSVIGICSSNDTCTGPSNTYVGCSRTSYSQCTDANERAECQAGDRTSCWNGTGSCGCTNSTVQCNQPAPTATPGGGGGYCGDGSCNNGETCSSCSGDCGSCGGGGTGEVRGFKVVMPGNQAIAPAASQAVVADGNFADTRTSNPYFFSTVGSGTHGFGVSSNGSSLGAPSGGWGVGYTSCTNVTSCHGSTPTSILGSYYNVNVPSGGYVDLWWHYYSPPTGSISGPASVCTGQSYTYTTTASATDLSSVGIYRSPTASQAWTTMYTGAPGAVNLSFPTPGTYYLVMNAYGTYGGACSGNPFGLPGNYGNCGASDAITLTVSNCPTATPVPPTATPVPPTPTPNPGPWLFNASMTCPINANGAAQHNITVSGSDSSGGSDIYGLYALVNYQGENAGLYRGYLTWGLNNQWPGYKGWRACTGGGWAVIQPNYGDTYIELDSCSTSVSGISRSATFIVRFNPSFTTPNNNDVSGYVWDSVVNTNGWTNFQTSCSLVAPTPTPTPPPNPTGLSVDPAACGTTTRTLRWNAVSGANRYAIRIDDLSTPWGGYTPFPGDTVNDNVVNTFYTVSTPIGASYQWWIHAVNDGTGWSSGVSGPGFDAPIKCPGPTNTPTRTPTRTNTPVRTNTPSRTPTRTNTPVRTNTPSRTPTRTNTPSRTPTGTIFAATATRTPTRTSTPSRTPTRTPTGTLAPSNTPTRTWTPSRTPTITPTRTLTPTRTPTITNTPPPGSCQTPTPRDPPSSSCVPPLGNGTITWEWNTVPVANQYEIDIQQFTGGVWVLVENNTWQNASFFGCSTDPVCNYTSSHPVGTYRSRVRAQNSTGSCAPSSFGYSPSITLGACATPTPTATNTPSPTPTPVGTIRGRAVEITEADTSCSAVTASTTYLGDIAMTVTGGSTYSLAPEPRVGGDYSSGIVPANRAYTIDGSDPSGNYIPRRACWWMTSIASWTDGTTTILPASGTLNWEFGFTPPGPWVQTKGGDVCAKTDVVSPLPQTGPVPREFNLPDDDTPGIVGYGSSYDFGVEPGSTADPVSSTDWLVNDSSCGDTVNMCEDYYKRLGAPTVVNYNGSGTKPTGAADGIYYYVGNLTVNTPWTITNGEKVILYVKGLVTIDASITLSPSDGTGFFSLIATDGITVTSNVGTGPTSTISVLDGVYITCGTFNTGTSNQGSGEERFVGRGTFAANDFALLRDLGSVNNLTNAAQLFIYNPQFLVTMPEEMLEVRIQWRETKPRTVQ